MAQLVEQSILTPEVRGSNPVIGKIYIEHCLLSAVLKIKKKRPGIVYFYKKHYGCVEVDATKLISERKLFP